MWGHDRLQLERLSRLGVTVKQSGIEGGSFEARIRSFSARASEVSQRY